MPVWNKEFMLCFLKIMLKYVFMLVYSFYIVGTGVMQETRQFWNVCGILGWRFFFVLTIHRKNCCGPLAKDGLATSSGCGSWLAHMNLWRALWNMFWLMRYLPVSSLQGAQEATWYNHVVCRAMRLYTCIDCLLRAFVLRKSCVFSL